MKNTTFSVDEDLIERAREKAKKEHRSLNKLIQHWLEEWIRENNRADEYDSLMEHLTEKYSASRRFSREEMNER